MRRPVTTTVSVFCPDSYTALMTGRQACSTEIISHVRSAVTAWNVPPARMLDRFTNLNRDYSGRFFDAKSGFVSPTTGKFLEAFVDMEPLEETPYEWWRDTFNPKTAHLPVLRVRTEAVLRWQSIGSIYKAWNPHKFHLAESAANDNRPPDSLKRQ